MKRFFFRLLLPLLTVVRAGCLPEPRIWWTPQGDRALVRIGAHLHIAKAAGDLGPALGNGLTSAQTQIRSACWLPDGSGFVCERSRSLRDWNEVRRQVPAEEILAVEQLLPAVQPLLEAAARLAQPPGTPETLSDALPGVEQRRFSLALLRAFQLDRTAVETRLRALPQGPDLVEALAAQEAGYEVHDLCLVRLEDGRAGTPQVLGAHLLYRLAQPRVSPRHPAVACLRLEEGRQRAGLEVLSLTGGTPLPVAQGVTGAFDWTPDGRALVFMTPIGGEGTPLHSLHRLDVLQENGRLLGPRAPAPAGDRLGEPTTLATSLVLGQPALQVLADGRTLIASQPATLPAAGAGPEPEPRLYLVQADGGPLQPVPSAPGALPTNLSHFVASPDGKRAAIVESETDALAVVELASGQVQLLSPAHPGWQGRTLPAWRSAEELTFAALDPADGRPHWQAWRPEAGIRDLSAGWPAEATQGWLERRQEPSPGAASP